jgi:DNA segregation ATPase FtsK/SpoIIIE, S-DNA-T family
VLYLILFLLAVVLPLAARPAVAVYYVCRAGRSAWHWAGPCLWATLRWRWLCRNIGSLAYIDKHHKRELRARVPFTTAVRVRPDPEHLMRWPRARFHVTEYGWDARVRTIPRVGRAELAKAAPWIADAWACYRVSVHQDQPGRLVVRGLRRDPLLEPYPMAAAPVEVYAVDGPPRRLYLGRDAWAAHRWANMANLPAVLVGGMPGYGKSVCITSWLCQLAPSPAVRLGLVADGKGGGDYLPWADVVPIVGDDLDGAAEALTRQADEMTRRLAYWPARFGVRNAWKLGPAPDRQLLVNVVDECHSFLDLDAVKGDKPAETAVRQCRHAVGQLVRKGRSVMCFTVLATQKQTGDSVPTSIRDNVPLALSFATRTREAAVACLGDGIREHPDQCPTTLAAPGFVGVATAMLRTGLDPYTQLRAPFVDEDQAEAVAAALAPARPPLRVVPATADQLPA